MERLGDLDLFLRVLDLGSISAAARSLDLSVAVASQRLQRLERELGVRLFQRTTRRLHPTPEGLALAQRGRPLLEELESLDADLRGTSGEVIGTLRVTLSAAFGRMWVSPLLPLFMARHPRLGLSTHLSDHYVDLAGEGFDLAIRMGAMEDSGLVSRRIAADRRVACASPDYLRRRGEPRTPDELAAHECLILSGRNGRRDVWRFATPGGGETSVRVNGRFESNLGDFIRDACLTGEGIGTFSYWHVAADLRAGRLRQLLPDHHLPTTYISAVSPHRQLRLPKVRAFVDFLVEHFGDSPPWERADDPR